MRTYFWDFFGPRAELTAEHFMKHLVEFVREHGIDGSASGRGSEGDGHAGVWLRVPDEHRELVERALRPRRFSED